MQKTFYYGSINLSKIKRELKKGNPAFYKSEKTGDLYLNINISTSDELDQFKNNGSISNSVTKEDKEKRFFFGNLKKSIKLDVDKNELDDLENIN